MPLSSGYSPENRCFPEILVVFNFLRGATYKRPLIVGYVSLQTFLLYLCVAVHGIVEGSHRRLVGAALYCLLGSSRQHFHFNPTLYHFFALTRCILKSSE